MDRYFTRKTDTITIFYYYPVPLFFLRQMKLGYSFTKNYFKRYTYLLTKIKLEPHFGL